MQRIQQVILYTRRWGFSGASAQKKKHKSIIFQLQQKILELAQVATATMAEQRKYSHCQ